MAASKARAALVARIMERIAADRPNWKADEPERALKTCAVWCDVLEGIADDVLIAAAGLYLRSRDEWPSAGKLRAIALQVADMAEHGDRPEPMEAWYLVEKLSGRVTAYWPDTAEKHALTRAKERDALHPAVREALEWCGGWQRTMWDETRARGEFQRRFLDAYRSVCAKRDRELDQRLARKYLQEARAVRASLTQ